MKTNQLLSIFVILSFSITLQSQTITRKFGNVSIEELKMDSYAKDPDAEAVVLFDIGKSFFTLGDQGFEIIFERVTRIKILTEAGLEWGEFGIPYYQEGGIFEKIYDLNAVVYNLIDGRMNHTSIDRNNIYDEKINDYWNLQKVALPNVRPGSVIEYRYKINSQYIFNLRDWNFQWKIPVVYSEYEAKITPFYEYVFILKGVNRFSSQESFVESGVKRRFRGIEYNNMVHRFGMNDLPAFKDEEFITSINDHIIRMDFQLSKINYPDGRVSPKMTTWPALINELNKHKDFGKYLNGSEKLAKRTIDMKQLDGQSEKERFNIIMDYMKGTYKWNNMNTKFASKTPRNFLKDQFGNNADINLFAIGMLRSAGIEAHPIILSTRNHGFIYKDYPFSHFFNYVLISAVVDGETILADASSLQIANDRIPLKCVNQEGLKVVKGEVNWVDLTVKKPSEMMVDFKINFNGDEMLVEVKKTGTEYEANKYRVNYGDNVEDLRSKLNIDGYNLIESSIKVENQNELNLPWNLSYTLKSDANYSTEKLILAPFLNLVLKDNPLKQNTRTYPIDMMYSTKKEYQSRIIIPEGYVVEHIPQNRTFDNQHFQINYTAHEEEGEIVVVFSYWFKQPIYEARLYPQLKTYFNEVVRKGNERIVLSKT